MAMALTINIIKDGKFYSFTKGTNLESIYRKKENVPLGLRKARSGFNVFIEPFSAFSLIIAKVSSE